MSGEPEASPGGPGDPGGPGGPGGPGELLPPPYNRDAERHIVYTILTT